MKKLLILFLFPVLSFGQNYINVEFQLKSGLPEYLSFDIPSDCIEMSGETLPPYAPENTVCMYVCDDNVIMFTDDWDMFSRNNKMHEKDDIVRQLKTKKFKNIFRKNLAQDSNTKVKKVSFEYVNNMPALKGEAVYKGQVNIFGWEIYKRSRRIGVTASGVNINYFNKTIESISILIISKDDMPNFVPEFDSLKFEMPKLEFDSIYKIKQNE